MPCADITDRLTLKLDPDDRLLDYSLQKRTCGAPVGSYNVLREWFDGKPIEQILETPFQTFSQNQTLTDATLEFVFWKHYRLVLQGLAAYLGQTDAGLNDEAVIVAMDYTPDGAEVIVDLKNDLPPHQVKPCGTSCGNCSGACGASKREERRQRRAGA